MADSDAFTFTIRPVRPEEAETLGQLLVAVYAELPGMPAVADQPEYYGMLRDVAKRTQAPARSIFAAIDGDGALLGSVDFIGDMQHYGSGGSAGTIRAAAGIRLLAVTPAGRGQGVGKALTRHCIQQAQALGRSAVILHTTRSMATAWGMYERMGFARFPELDFQQGKLEVFGFRLELLDRGPQARPRQCS